MNETETKVTTLETALGYGTETFPIHDRDTKEDRMFFADPLPTAYYNKHKRLQQRSELLALRHQRAHDRLHDLALRGSDEEYDKAEAALKALQDELAAAEAAATDELAAALNARAVDGQPVTREWVEANVPAKAMNELARILFTGKVVPAKNN
jgi:hypothetical protein